MSQNALLATGIDGLVGSRFAELYRDEWEIENLSLSTGVDITDQQQVEERIAAHPGKFVIHLAAFTDTAAAAAQAGDQEGLCYQVNVIGTRHVAQACAAHGKHLIHISTDFVFDGEKESAYTEEDQPNPIEWYGTTKLMAEQAVAAADGEHAIVRIAFPYRATYVGKKDYVAKIRQGLEEGNLRPQFGDTLFTPTFVDDIAHGLQVLLEHDATGLYHLTGGQAYSHYDAAIKIAEAYHLDESQIQRGSLEEYLKMPGARRFHRRLNISPAKFEREFGHSMATLEEGLASIVDQTDEQLVGME